MIDDIKNQLIHIEEYVPKAEKEIFLQYQEKWRRKKHISDLWRDAESFQFPLFFRNEFHAKVRKLSEDDIAAFIELLSVVDSPMVLHEILYSTLYNRANSYNILDVLRNAPFTKGISNNGTFDGKSTNYLFNDVIDSIIAPVALEILMWKPLQVDERDDKGGTDEAGEACEKDDDLLDKICDVLKSREDGFFLAYHYMKHLLKNERKNSGYYDVLNAIADAFESKNIFIQNGSLAVEGLTNDTTHKDKFLTTGELYDLKLQEGDFEGDILTNYRTALWFVGIEGAEEILYETFKRIFPYQSRGFFTYDNKFYLKHYDIARVLLAQKNPIKAWNELMEMLSASVQRISFQYFGDQGMNIRYHHAFMWSVGQRMLDVYCKDAIDSNKSLPSAKEMWRTLWNEGIQYMRRFSRYIDECERNYIASLICYYYCCLIRDTADIKSGVEECKFEDLASLFYEIREFPIVCVTSMMMLDNNNLRLNTLFDCDRKFFDDICNKALMMAEGNFAYTFVESFLKKRLFSYSSVFMKNLII